MIPGKLLDILLRCAASGFRVPELNERIIANSLIEPLSSEICSSERVAGNVDAEAKNLPGSQW
jgi:hypothetical protein